MVYPAAAPDFRITDAGGAYEQVSYLHRDHLSSVRLITNAAGQAEQSTSYSPYGDPSTDTLIASTSGFGFATPEEHGFIGERHDVLPGLLYLNGRYLAPPRKVHPARLVGGAAGRRRH